MTNIQAIDLLKGLEQSLDDYCELNDEGKSAFYMAITALEVFGNSEQLPSAQPERAEGEWVQIQRCARDAQPDLECPFCKHRIGWFDMGRYCAGCGAKLKGGAG